VTDTRVGGPVGDGAPVGSECRELIVCVWWSSADSSAFAVGAVVTLLIRSEILQVRPFCTSTCDK
jgi:hypothetical protein